MLIKILRLAESIDEMFSCTNFFMDEIKYFLVPGCDDVAVRFAFVKKVVVVNENSLE